MGQPEDGGVVDHSPGLVADGRVGHLPDRELAHVAGDGRLDEDLGVRPQHLPLAQRGEVHDHGLLATGPVLGDPALVVVAVGEPVAAVLHEALGELPGPRVKRRLLGEHWLGLRGHAVGDGRLKAVLGRVDAHVHVGDLPAVGGIDVVRAGRRRAHEVVHGPQQHVVAGPRPGLVHHQLVVAVEARVVEEVERLPAGPLGDPVGGDLRVEVLGAADVPRVAQVLVVLGLAGEREHVVAADGVLHHLHQRVMVDVVELRVQARAWAPRCPSGCGWSRRPARAPARPAACARGRPGSPSTACPSRR